AHVSLEARRPHRRVPEWIVAFEAAFDFRPRSFLAVQTQSQLRLARALHLGDQFRQAAELARTADDVHVRSPAADQLLVLLRHAAEDAQDLPRMLLFMRAQPAERAVDFVFGMLPHTA